MNNIVFGILGAVLLLGIFFFIKYKNKQNKLKQQRKLEDIENNYINTLRSLNTKEEKLAYIKQCNSELNRNIFFTEQQAKDLVAKLINI